MIESEASGQLFYTKPSPATGYGNFSATTAPTSGDDEIDNYSVNSLWYKTAFPQALWICVDATQNAAIWREIPLSDFRSTRTIFGHNTDYTTTKTTGQETILTESVPVYTLEQHGDAVFFRLAGRFAANGNSKTVSVIVEGAGIISSGAITSSGTKWEIDGFFEQKSTTTLRYEANFTTTGITSEVSEGTITGVTSPISFLVDAETPTLAGDVTMSLCRAWFMPGRNLVQGGLTFLGEPVNFFNVETAFNA